MMANDLKEEICTLQEQIKLLKEEQKKYILYQFEEIPDGKAEGRVVSYLRQLRKKRGSITVFEISQQLKLPADQVERVIDKMERKKMVKWAQV